VAVRELAAARLTSHLNALSSGSQAVARAAIAVVGDDLAHHVADPDGLTALDPWRAVVLADALPTLAAAEPEGWVLALPMPGAPGLLRGPDTLTRAALDAGAAVVGRSGGLALVPYAVGPAMQWRAYRAERPAAPPSPYEAERTLSETVLLAARALAHSSARSRSARPDVTLDLPPGLTPRQVAAADRAARLLRAADPALAEDGPSLSAHDAGVRAGHLQALRVAAAEALTAAVSQLDRDRAGWR